jgi:hypothetical protein
MHTWFATAAHRRGVWHACITCQPIIYGGAASQSEGPVITHATLRPVEQVQAQPTGDGPVWHVCITRPGLWYRNSSPPERSRYMHAYALAQQPIRDEGRLHVCITPPQSMVNSSHRRGLLGMYVHRNCYSMVWQPAVTRGSCNARIPLVASYSERAAALHAYLQNKATSGEGCLACVCIPVWL